MPTKQVTSTCAPWFTSGASLLLFRERTMLTIRCIRNSPPALHRSLLLLLLLPSKTISAAASSRVCGPASKSEGRLTSSTGASGSEQSTAAASFQPTTAQRHAAAASAQRVEAAAMDGQQTKPDQPLKPIDPITKRYDDMHESYGEGYATRSSEEGFGGIYTSPLGTGGESKSTSQAPEDDMDPAKEPEVDFDLTQGSPVAEKERATRHGGAHGSAGFTSCSPSD